MKRTVKRFLSLLLLLCMALALMPTALAAGPDGEEGIYVSSAGSDDGDGSQENPYASLSRAVEKAPDGATIYVMSDLTVTSCARYYNKALTITSGNGQRYTISRGDNFETLSDPARSWYNPAMIEVQGYGEDVSCGLTLANIILDDCGKHEGAVFAQAISGDAEEKDNLQYVQDAMIASNAVIPCTITLAGGAVLQNFGGMSAVRVTDSARLVMEKGSKITDTTVTDRDRGTTRDEVGPAGAVWMQGGELIMDEGAEISSVVGRAVYADGGSAKIGGTFDRITGSKQMWRGTNGTAVHIRNGADVTLTSTNKITGCTKADSMVYVENRSTLTAEKGSEITDGGNKAIQGMNDARILYNGIIHDLVSGAQAINLNVSDNDQTGAYCEIQKDARIYNITDTYYGAIYVQGQGLTLHISGQIYHNTTKDGHGAGLCMANNWGEKTVYIHEGAKIYNNYSIGRAGGVQVAKGALYMDGGEITGNIAQSNGGGVYVLRGGQFCMTGGTISNNAAEDFGGGVVFDASDWGETIPKAELLGGTIAENKMNAVVVKDSATEAYIVTDGASNDLAVSQTAHGHTARYLLISDAAALGNDSVYFETDAKTVTATADSPDIKLGNASPEGVGALTADAAEAGLDTPFATLWAQRAAAATLRARVPGGVFDPAKPVWVVRRAVAETGLPSEGDDAELLAAVVEADGQIRFDLPGSVNGYDVALCQPANGGGTLVLRTTVPMLKEKESGDYEIPYTITFTPSQSISSAVTRVTVGIVSPLDGESRTVALTKDSSGAWVGAWRGTLRHADFVPGGSVSTSAIATVEAGEAERKPVYSNGVLTELLAAGPVEKPDPDWPVLLRPNMLNTDSHTSYLVGYNDGMLRPNGNITRGEAATIFFRLLTDEARNEYWSQSNSYSDCVSGLWCNNAISTLSRMGIIDGFADGSFRPNAPITRAEFAKIAVSFCQMDKADYHGTFRDVDAGKWYTPYVEAAAQSGLIYGEGGKFRPDDNITRAEVCVIVNRLLGRRPDKAHLLPSRLMVNWPDCSTDAWYYADMMEASISHAYTWLTDSVAGRQRMEQWTDKRPQRNWTALEHEWSTAHSDSMNR